MCLPWNPVSLQGFVIAVRTSCTFKHFHWGWCASSPCIKQTVLNLLTNQMLTINICERSPNQIGQIFSSSSSSTRPTVPLPPLLTTHYTGGVQRYDYGSQIGDVTLDFSIQSAKYNCYLISYYRIINSPLIPLIWVSFMGYPPPGNLLTPITTGLPPLATYNGLWVVGVWPGAVLGGCVGFKSGLIWFGGWYVPCPAMLQDIVGQHIPGTSTSWQ